MSARRLEHGTPEGYDRGCTRHDRCPALPVHGLTCETAHIRFATGERRYMTLRARNLPAMAIAQRLGLTPPRPEPVDSVEAQIAAYAIAKEKRDRAAAASAETPGGGAAVDEDHLEATGAPARTAPGPTPDPTPAVCPECAAGKHGNCDGTAWDHVADEPATCSCTHPENTPDNQEQTMPKRKTAPTSTPATKPQPPKPFDGSGRTKAERAEIRAWAEANGILIGTAGRIPRAVIDAYDAATAASAAGDESDVSAVSTPAWGDTMSGEPVVGDGPEAETRDANVEEVGEYVYADASDALDETRARIDSPVAEVKEDRPDWSHVAVSEDVERARDLAVRLEAENANLITQLDTIGGGLTFALEAWDAAGHRASAAEAALSEAHAAHARAIEHLLRTIAHQLADVARLSTERERARNDLAAARGTIEQLRARRWWQIGRAQ